MYIGIDADGVYDLYEEEEAWWTSIYDNTGLLVYDVGTGSSIIVGKELVFYKVFEAFIIELNLSTCKLRYIHGRIRFISVKSMTMITMTMVKLFLLL